MPAVRFKQYKIAILAGTNVAASGQVAVAPMTPDRCFMLIENTGANPGVFQFKNPIKNDGSDLILAVGAVIRFDQTLEDGTFNGPIDALFVGATLATTYAILEGVRQRG